MKENPENLHQDKYADRLLDPEFDAVDLVKEHFQPGLREAILTGVSDEYDRRTDSTHNRMPDHLSVDEVFLAAPKGGLRNSS